ncbi:MAG: hypothetical protein AABY36_04750 [Campylobacterota bacterium]
MFDILTDSFTNAIRKIRFHDDEKALTKALDELKKSLLKTINPPLTHSFKTGFSINEVTILFLSVPNNPYLLRG